MPGAAAAERVRAVLAVAARAANPSDPLGDEARRALTSTSGLSAEGVELALSRHTETAIDDAGLASLLAWAGEAPRCHVVLSANVCTAAVRALALATAGAPEVVVRPSRRDPGLAPILVRELSSCPQFRKHDGTITITESVAARAGDVVHAYGSDASLEAIEAALPRGAHFRGHGTGFGVGFVAAAASIDDTARALAADVVAFDQRGCLSPRLALVAGGLDRARGFASRLSAALGELGRRVPRGPLDAASAGEVASFRRLAASLGECFEERDHLVAFFPEAAIPPLPPAARIVSVTAVGDADACARAIAPYSAFLTTVGGDLTDDAARSLAALETVRFTRIGQMQSPPLDGPGDPRGGCKR
jgi:hypothetical protein